MRRILLAAAVTALVLAGAVPAYAARATIFQSHFKGLLAEAVFDSVEPSGCVETFVDVFAIDGRTSLPGGVTAQSDAETFIEVFDNCTGTELLAAFGFVELAPPEFQIDAKLTSASLDTTITVEDFVSGNSFPISVSVDWSGTGASFRVLDTFHVITPGFHETDTFNGLFREANATGTVSDGTTNFTPEPAVFADMGNVKSGSVSISH